MLCVPFDGHQLYDVSINGFVLLQALSTVAADITVGQSQGSRFLERRLSLLFCEIYCQLLLRVEPAAEQGVGATQYPAKDNVSQSTSQS